MTIKEQEREMIIRFQGGEEPALYELAKLHAGMMHNLAMRWSFFNWEEVAAAKLIACWVAARTFDLSRTTGFMAHYAWKFRAEMSKVSYTTNGRGDMQRAMIQAELPDRRIPDDRRAEVKAAQDEVADLLEYLKPKQRYVLERIMAGHTHKEIAAEFGCTRQNISLTVMAAYRVLRGEPESRSDDTCNAKQRRARCQTKTKTPSQ